MTHVIDELELYALGALSQEEARGVERHIAACPPCRAAADELTDLVGRLPDAIAPREPSAALRGRILAAARTDLGPRRILPRLPRLAFDVRFAAIAATVVILLGIAGERSIRVASLQAETAEYESIRTDLAHGGRTWYMAGLDQWRGSGGNLMQPSSGDPAFVVFHDLRPVDKGQLYALWLISPDGKWVRGASFKPDGRDTQVVTLDQDLAGFDRCAVTIETSWNGKRDGPIVMQSRIAPPAP